MLVAAFGAQTFMDIVVVPKLFFGADVYVVKVFLTTFLFFVIVPGLVIVNNEDMREMFCKKIKKLFRKE
jgi:hypothetical protein